MPKPFTDADVIKIREHMEKIFQIRITDDELLEVRRRFKGMGRNTEKRLLEALKLNTLNREDKQ